jgi:hypothetical protein
VDLSDLTIEVTRGEALAKQFYKMHPLTGSRLLANDERFCFDTASASAVVSGDLLPQCATKVL